MLRHLSTRPEEEPMTVTTPSTMPTIQEQASVVLAHAAGYAQGVTPTLSAYLWPSARASSARPILERPGRPRRLASS
jgi:hypothetical protein